MASLLEKIQANAIQRLKPSSERTPQPELDQYKRFLKLESHRIKMLHRSGAGGREACHVRAGLLDILIRHLYESAKSRLSPQAQKEFPPMALVALGGYGRAELNPFSDIDFMFLHQGQVAGNKPLPFLSKVMDGVLYPLWDMGFKVGHSVRTVNECINIANSDMQAKTSLLEARLITGDQKAFEKFQKSYLAKCVERHEDEYIAARLEDQTSRRAKHGNSPTMQEPNLKSGCGGLRDFQNLHWMAYFKYRTRTLAEMETRESISASERRALESAYDFLLAVRTEIHYRLVRPRPGAMDVLTKALQPSLATAFGFGSRSAHVRVEQFMREVYVHMRNIYLITRTVEDRLALQPQARGKGIAGLTGLRRLIRGQDMPPEVQTTDGFKIANGKIHAASNRIFRDQPRRLMRVFLHAQQRGLRIHPDLAQRIRQELALVNREFRYDEHVRETFLEILSQRGNVAPTLRSMHEVGLLGKYLPEFGRLTCLVQHEFYHRYTADEHTLLCLEKMDQLWKSGAAAWGRYSAIFQEVERPFILYLALLLHDAGKAKDTKNHSLVSAVMADKVSKRLLLDPAASRSLRLLIEKHLVMAQVSQRRDLDDQQVVHDFASQVETAENLRMLALHSVADALATSEQLWNGFKDALLQELYSKTLEAILGNTEFKLVERKQLERLATQAEGLLPPTISHEEVQAHFNMLPASYFQAHTAEEIVLDINLTHRFMQRQLEEEERALQPVVDWRTEPDRGHSRARVCTWDRAGLFSKIAGSFSAAGLNILGAEVFTRLDGIVLDNFLVTDAASGALPSREQRELFERILFEALTRGNVDFRALMAKLKPSRPLYQSLENERMATLIRFDNSASGHRTIIEVETEDRLGVLYDLCEVFTDLNISISLAKIATEKGAAIDSFYVYGPEGQKIVDPGFQKEIENRLRAVLALGAA